jgi:mersacidin/lichenicidin family type 2 lantibiotic
MPTIDVVRAWKDAEYRARLCADERAALPAHPAGPIDLTDGELDEVAGGLARKSPGLGCGLTQPLNSCNCFQWG